MGSLMGGWGSHTLDPNSASLQRNRSLTKEEINAFWKSKKEIEDEHIKAISNLSKTIIQPGKYEDSKNLRRSRTVPFATKKESLGVDVDTNLEQLIKKNGWWTKSNWAFLNEPPVIEAASNKYESQFDVANLGSAKTNPGDGISG